MPKQTNLNFVISQWQQEVDQETIDLIEAGMPPYEATERAALIVSRRRREKNADKSGG